MQFFLKVNLGRMVDLFQGTWKSISCENFEEYMKRKYKLDFIKIKNFCTSNQRKKIDKLNVKIENFCASKDTIKKMQRKTPTE